MRVFYKAVALLAPGVVGALAIPERLSAPDLSEPKGADVESPVRFYDEAQAQAQIQLKCGSCFENEKDARLILNLQAFPSERGCGASNITINDKVLALDWEGLSASGKGVITPSHKVQSNFERLTAEWHVSCLNSTNSASDEGLNDAQSAIQVLSFTIQEVDGIELQEPQEPLGFSISFQQTPNAELHRLTLDPSAPAQDVNQWLAPVPHQLWLPDGDDDSSQGDFERLSIEEQLEEIRDLKDQVRVLKQMIKYREEAVHAQVKEELNSLREEIKQCKNIKCVASAMMRRVHGAIKVLAFRIRPASKDGTLGSEALDTSVWSWSPRRGKNRPSFSHAYPQCHGNGTLLPHHHHPPPPSHHGHHTPPESEALPPAIAPNALQLPKPPHFGRPQDSPEHQDGESHSPFGDEKPPNAEGGHWHKDGETHVSSHRKYRPHFRGDGQQGIFHRVLVGLQVLASFLGLGCIIIFIHKRCRNPRSCHDRRQRREERRAARRYRRAARRQAWRDWWHSRRGCGTLDYEEKRALVVPQEALLEAAMQAEIAQLQNAHEVVHSMVQAEEGRAPIPRALVRSDSLPDYQSEAGRSEPPAYDENDGSNPVADGFQYTHSGPRGTPASSVIDISPRQSSDTFVYREEKGL